MIRMLNKIIFNVPMAFAIGTQEKIITFYLVANWVKESKLQYRRF